MRNITVKGLGAGLAALTVFAYTASGQFFPVTYVDATHGAGGNTTMPDGSVWEPLVNADADGEWRIRGTGTNDDRGFGNGGIIYQSPFGSDGHRLVTSVSGLPEETYDVFVYFWSDPSPWRIRASLTDDAELPLFIRGDEGVVQFYDGANATIMSSTLDENPFDADIMVAEDNRRLFQAHVGTFTGTEFSVFLADGQITGQENRTWYDGIGYAVVPEPSTYALFLGLGVFGLLAIRRYRRKS